MPRKSRVAGEGGKEAKLGPLLWLTIIIFLDIVRRHLSALDKPSVIT